MIELVVIVTCIALFFGASVLFFMWLMEQFKDEKPSWDSYLSNGVKFWKQIKK